MYHLSFPDVQMHTSAHSQRGRKKPAHTQQFFMWRDWGWAANPEARGWAEALHHSQKLQTALKICTHAHFHWPEKREGGRGEGSRGGGWWWRWDVFIKMMPCMWIIELLSDRSLNKLRAHPAQTLQRAGEIPFVSAFQDNSQHGRLVYMKHHFASMPGNCIDDSMLPKETRSPDFSFNLTLQRGLDHTGNAVRWLTRTHLSLIILFKTQFEPNCQPHKIYD